MSIFLSLLYATLYISLHCHASEEQHTRRSIPPPPLPPAPDSTSAQGTTTTTTTDAIADATPLQVSKGQCSLGTNLSSSSPDNSYTLQRKLYADVGAPAPCTGVVTRWEVCFNVTEETSSDNLIDFVVLRYDENKGGYLIVNAHEIRFESSLDSGINCDYIDDSDGSVSMEEGDVMGFLNGDNIQVALVALPEGMNSTLKVLDLSLNCTSTTSARCGKAEVPCFSLRVNNTSIQQEGHFAALIRIVLNSTETTTKATPPPGPSSNHPTTCKRARSCSDKDIARIVVTVVQGAVILILVPIVICLACSLCQRQRRLRAMQRPGVESLFEQSMQYNDLYVPSDQHKTLSKWERKHTNIQRNPAYTTNQPLEPEPVGGKHTLQDHKEYETTTFSKVADEQPEVEADLEHTYEMIRSIKL